MASLKVVLAVAACFAVLVLLNDVVVGVGAECEACSGSCEDCKDKCDTCQAEGDKICTSAVEGSGVCLTRRARCSHVMDTSPDCEACKAEGSGVCPAPQVKCSDNKDTSPDCVACKDEKKGDCKKQYYDQVCVIREKSCPTVV